MPYLKFLIPSLLIAASGPAAASELVYRPHNPSFGGSPLNSGHLMALANAQRKPTRSGTFESDPGELFVRQLQSRLLSELASQVEQAIFGENPQDQGTITFGNQTIEFERGLEFIMLRILNTATGAETEINVPLLEVQNR